MVVTETLKVFNPLHSDGFPIQIDTISMELSILHFKGLPLKTYVFLSLKIVFTNNVARTLKKICTSKGDYWINQ